jgi:hypothetical protein
MVMRSTVLIAIGIMLYLANSIFEIYIQYLYFTNPALLASVLANVPSPVGALVVYYASSGYYGILGCLSILTLVVMMYLLINHIEGKRYARIGILIATIVQLFLGNSGYIVGLVIMIIAIMRSGHEEPGSRGTW